MLKDPYVWNMEKDKKNYRKKKDDDSEDQRPNRNDENGGDNMPRFSFTWIYVLIGLSLFGLHIWNTLGAVKVDISWEKFQEAAKKGHVKKVEIENNKMAHVFILDSLVQNDPAYADLKPNPKSLNSKKEHYYAFNIGTPEVFNENLRDLNASLPKNTPDRKSVV